MIRDVLLPANRWLEPLFCMGIAAAVAYCFGHLYFYGYLPQPFFYVPEDTYMDWFNPAYWAHNPGAYDAWGTIYPPLSFVFLRFLTDPTCYVTEGYSGRACDTYGLITLHLVYLVNCVLVAKTFLKIDRKTAIWRSFALCAGLPMLYALERGNILLLCFTCVILAYGPLLESARMRWVAAAFAINFKIYLIGTLFAQLLRRRWRWFEGAFLTTAIVYLVSFAIYGGGWPSEIFRNIKDYATLFIAGTPLDLWYSITYRPLLTLLKGDFPSSSFVGSYWVELFTVAIPILIYATQALIAAAAAAAWWRPAAAPQFRLIFLAIAIALVTSEAGGYTQVLLLLFVFMEQWKGVGRKLAILIAYVLSVPGEILISHTPPTAQPGFFGLTQVTTEFGVGLMPFLRPGLVIIMTVALSLVTIRDAIADARRAGWQLPFGPSPGRKPALVGRDASA